MNAGVGFARLPEVGMGAGTRPGRGWEKPSTEDVGWASWVEEC